MVEDHELKFIILVRSVMVRSQTPIPLFSPGRDLGTKTLSMHKTPCFHTMPYPGTPEYPGTWVPEYLATLVPKYPGTWIVYLSSWAPGGFQIAVFYVRSHMKEVGFQIAVCFFYVRSHIKKLRFENLLLLCFCGIRHIFLFRTSRTFI